MIVNGYCDVLIKVVIEILLALLQQVVSLCVLVYLITIGIELYNMFWMYLRF